MYYSISKCKKLVLKGDRESFAPTELILEDWETVWRSCLQEGVEMVETPNGLAVLMKDIKTNTCYLVNRTYQTQEVSNPTPQPNKALLDNLIRNFRSI